MSDKRNIKPCNLNWFKSCFVPSCKNTNYNAPNKEFIHVPWNPLKRKMWCDAVGYPSKLAKTSFCCEDHFNLKEDLSNYMEYKLMGSKKMLKEGVLPRFNVLKEHVVYSEVLHEKNQLDKGISICSEEGEYQFLAKSGSDLSYENLECSSDIKNLKESTEESNLNKFEIENDFCNGASNQENQVDEFTNMWFNVKSDFDLISENSDYSNDTDNLKVNSDNKFSEKQLLSDITSDPLSENKSYESKYIEAKPKLYSKYCQKYVHTHNKSSQTSKVSYTSIGVLCNILPKLSDKFEKLRVTVNDSIVNTTSESIDSNILDSSISYKPSSHTTSTDTTERKLALKILQDTAYENYTKHVIQENPLVFIGISKESMYVINLLHEESGVSLKNIFLILKKIKTNLSSAALAYEFSLSEAQVNKIFKKDIHVIAQYLKQLIIWPSKRDILLNLPIQFRKRFSDVQSIIDCFEIEIEKPSDAMHQSLTWSDYKKCNTSKYLISVTPDGLINFISEGVCGRSSDMAIVQNCGYLDVLPANTSVLADRGFKQLDAVLHTKKCKLVRPPSVMQNVKSSKKEVKLTKQIASVRIHVERVINRIRNFQFLNIHSRVDIKLLDCLDSAVFIVAALVNLQSEIIKQY